MPQSIFTFSGGLPLPAWQWDFEGGAKIWKIAYNPKVGFLPACISCFTHKKPDHGILQKQIDKYFAEVMGRGGENAKGDSHKELHTWIKEPYGDADIHHHDHWVIKAGRFDDEEGKFLDGLDTRPEIILEIVLRHVQEVKFANPAEIAKALAAFKRWNDED